MGDSTQTALGAAASASEELGEISQINVVGADLLIRQNRFEQAVGAAIKVVVHDDGVARFKHHEQGCFGGHAGRESETGCPTL